MRITSSLSLALLVATLSCSDTGSDSLLGSRRSTAGEAPTTAGSGTPGSTASGAGEGEGQGQSGSSGGATSSSPPTTPTGDGGVTPSGDGGSGGRPLFEALLPAFDTACGGACHVQGQTGAPPYLGGADAYTTIKTYQGMIAPTAAQSILLTKGQHEGPALADPLKTTITNWLAVEAAAVSASGPAETSPISVATGQNTVDLSKLGIAGVSLGFTASVSGDILTLSALQIAAPAASGIQVTFPIFYVNATGGAQTENDDFSNVSETVAAGASAPLGTGLLIFTGWAATDTLQIAFTQLAPATVSADAGASGGCKAVAAFTQNAVPAIQNNTSLNCHNTGRSGNAALDLSELAASPADDATA